MQYIIILFLSVLYLQADIQTTRPTQNFDEFLREALQKSAYLQASMTNIAKSKEEGSLLQRYENPSLELELSNFSPDIGNSKTGTRAAINQPLRLWGVADDKKQLAQAMLQGTQSQYRQKRALFIKNLSLLYLDYAREKKFLHLVEETQSIAKTIYDISKARYESGTIAKGIMLQSKIDYEMLEVQKDNFVLQTSNSYYALLKYAGVYQDISLDANYVFKVQGQEDKKNPDIQLLVRKKQKALSEATLNTNKIEWLNLYAEYEKEPDQDISRFGISIPLAVFNTKSQEKQIALLEAKKSDILISNEKKKITLELNRLQDEKKSLQSVVSKYQKLIISETKLLAMFQKAYKISNINLLALQDVKNRVIRTKEALIKIEIALSRNAILTNYIQGNYNE